MAIGIIDYNAGNPMSVLKMLRKLGIAAFISGERRELSNAEKYILPGIGSFDHAMAQMRKTAIADMLHQRVIMQHAPLLGICLGAQLLTESSEEGVDRGLEWIPATAIGFAHTAQGLKVPHMGWNSANRIRHSRLLADLEDNAHFYFAHSYYIQCRNSDYAIGQTTYGVDFISAIERENIAAVQFHPEKSGDAGFAIFKNFARNF